MTPPGDDPVRAKIWVFSSGFGSGPGFTDVSGGSLDSQPNSSVATQLGAQGPERTKRCGLGRALVRLAGLRRRALLLVTAVTA